ncbi:hypothetical protein QFC21_002469, partial [Naganishia friedmannii]
MPISDEQLDRQFFHAVEALAKLQTTESIALAGLLFQLPTSRSPTMLPNPFLVSIASPTFHFDPEEAYRLGRITHSLTLQTTLLLGNVALTEFETPEEDSPKDAGKKTGYIVPDSQVQKETDPTDHRDAPVYGHVLWLLSWKLDRGLQENGWSLEFDEKEKLVDLSLSALRLLCTSPEMQLKMKDMDVVERLYIGRTLRWPASYEVYLSQLFLKVSKTWTLEGILSAMPVIHITFLQQLFDNGAKKMKDERRESATWERMNSQIMPPKDRVRFVSNLDKRTDWTLKPWPTGAMPLQIANRFHEWVEQLCCDIRNDEFLLAFCKQWRETIPQNPAWMIMHFQFAEPSLQLLEAIRTALPDRPVPKELFQKCCLITDESMGRLEKCHGIYAQYQWVQTPEGFEHRIYIGKGAAKHTSLSTSHTANTSGHMGILQRVLSYNSERQKRPKNNARPHYKYMLNLQPAGTRVIQEYWIVLFAATALDNITISYGVRTEETDAVQTLFQPRLGDFQQQEYGVDATTKGLVNAQWQYLETLAIIACGIDTIDAPRGHGKTIARGM